MHFKSSGAIRTPQILSLENGNDMAADQPVQMHCN
jgi:hypothetical protein